MIMDKSTLDEEHPSYVGMYDGKLMNEEVRVFVESCDCVLCIGAMMTDFNTAAFTARIDRFKSISIAPDHVRVGAAIVNNIAMKDVLRLLTTRIQKKIISAPRAHGLDGPVGRPADKITVEYLYPRWQQMLRPDDIVIAETGTPSLGLSFARMPRGSTFQNQTLWGSVGWATPAAFGAALSAPKRRTILITGDGSHQLTAQEVGQFHRFGLKPIIFVLNNAGYLTERLLCKHPDCEYNDIAPWRYDKLPEALGCDDWFTARVTTCGELDKAIEKAESCRTGAYIEVVTDKYEAPPLSQKMHKSVATLYAAADELRETGGLADTAVVGG
jgi:indolepyruvate decarboxylase